MSRIIGIDVGGTNTNAAFVQDGNLIAIASCPTNHQDLLSTTTTVLERIASNIPHPEEQSLRLHLSTTLTTNAIMEGRGEPAAVIITHGPGVNPTDLEFPFPSFPVAGAIDHRGRETEPLNAEEVRQTLQRIRRNGIRALAVVGKFSVRNPSHELEIEELVRHEFPEFNAVTLGHRLSGRLNFPRRVVTAFLNASIFRLQAEFASMVKGISGRYGIQDPIFLLKADGGTMYLPESLVRPLETVLSGPAASIMGALALGEYSESHTAITLDIGGTTTEIAVLVKGEPLGERDGAVIANYRTLVPAFFTRSVGLGGDSQIRWSDGSLQIGPEREGPPVALGGPCLTPTDAVIVLEDVPLGDVKKARVELERVGREAGLAAEELARRIIAAFCEKAVREIGLVLKYLNNIPVYTVSEVLAPRELKPEKLIGMGGPAGYFLPKIAAAMGIDYQVLPCAEAANAIGAAVSRPTVAINLRADTALGKLVVPELDLMEDIQRAMLFDVRKARRMALEKAADFAVRTGAYQEAPEIEIGDEEVFNVVRGFYTAGKIFSLKAQVRPGINRVKIPYAWVQYGKKE